MERWNYYQQFLPIRTFFEGLLCARHYDKIKKKYAHTHIHTQQKEQVVLPVEFKEGFGENGYFEQGLKEPVGVCQADSRMKRIPDTRKARSPLFIIYLEPKLSPKPGRQQFRDRESRGPQATVPSQLGGSGQVVVETPALTPD